MQLTDIAMRSLKAPVKGQKYYKDGTLPGFGCRVSQGGTKTFVVVHGADRRFVTIGRYPIITVAEARTEAKKLLAEATLGKHRPSSISYTEAVKLFLADKAKLRRPATVADYERRLKRLGLKGNIADITHDEAARKVERLKAPSERSHTLVAGKVFFTWCMKRRWRSDNPLFGLSKPKHVARKRVLSDEEIVRVWKGTNEPTKHNQIVRLLLVTGQRRGEVEQWEPKFLEEGLLTVPGTITKNHVEQLLPLGEMALELLETFPDRLTNWGDYKASLDKRTGINEPWMLRDLRRTFRTGLSKLKVQPHVAERLMHHISATDPIALIYDRHAYLDEMRDAVERWEGHLAKLIAPPTT